MPSETHQEEAQGHCYTFIHAFLSKLVTGISSRVLSPVFKILKSSIKRAVSNVRKALQSVKKPSLPLLGFGHISRA